MRSLRLPGRGCEPITLWGNPVLREKATAITVFDKSVKRLVDELFETMYAIDIGVGLAANQIGRTERVFVFDCRDDVVGYVINPEITIVGSELQNGTEGCLSLPGQELTTVRSERCTVVGQDVNGDPIKFDAEGLRSRCFQHEIDHLDGVLYIDHHHDATRATVEQQMRSEEWFGLDSIDPKSKLYRSIQDLV